MNIESLVPWLTLPMPRVDQEGVAELGITHRAVRDPHLCAIEHVMIAVSWMALVCMPKHVRPSSRLAHAHSTNLLAGAGIWEDTSPSVRIIAVHLQVVGEQHRVREVRESANPGSAAESSSCDDHGSDGIKARAAKSLVDGHAEQARDPRA